MKPRKRLTLMLLIGVLVSAVLTWFAVAMRSLAPVVVMGPYKFRIVAISNRRIQPLGKRLPAEQVWITLELDPSDPNKRVSDLQAYLPRLLQYVELVGPDGSRQKPFWRQPLPSIAWYDSIRKIGRASYLQMSFGFDNTAHWKTATLTAHFDSSNWRMTDPEELTVSGKTLRISPITLP
jgi:hypothetical protein